MIQLCVIDYLYLNISNTNSLSCYAPNPAWPDPVCGQMTADPQGSSLVNLQGLKT